MDYSGIGFVYGIALICRVIIYSLIIGWYDIMWVKYISHNTKAYRDGLIKLYEEQCDWGDTFMYEVLQKAIGELQSGKNPTKVEDWVVEMEKLFRTKTV
jgi:hypothetical protein